VRQWLPSAEQVVIGRCGHVPQVECPDETNRRLLRFFAWAERTQLDAVHEIRSARAA
jgi:hypothetical protein